MATATLDLFSSCLEIQGRTVVAAQKTYKGWRWYSNVGRFGRKLDYPTKEAALRSAAKTMGIEIGEVIEDDSEVAK